MPMPQPWWQLALQQPGLLLEHGGAWSGLLASETPALLRLWRRRLRLRLAAAAGLVLALGLAGVAAMLWALAPASALAAPAAVQALVAVPALPLLAALLCWYRAAGLDDGGAAQRLLLQWQAEQLLWRCPAAPAESHRP